MSSAPEHNLSPTPQNNMPSDPERNTPGDNENAGGLNNQGSTDAAEHLNIKVTDNQNEVFFKIKRTTKLEKLMNAFCERQGKSLSTVRFLFDGQRIQPEDTPDELEMHDGDTLEVHQEQLGGSL